MLVRQVQEVRAAEELYPAQLDEIHREQRRDGAKRKSAHDAVAQRLALLLFRKTEREDGQHHRVVGAQQAFEQHEQRDGDEVGRMEHRSQYGPTTLTRYVSRSILG